MRKVNYKIKDFFLTNRQVRKVRSRLQQKVFPFVLKSFLVVITFILFCLISIKIFKPQYLDKIYSRTSFYFFHYLNLDNHDFGKINIVGNNRVSEEEVIAIVKDVKANMMKDKTQNYQPLIQKLVLALKERLLWIDQIVITRNMPDILNIAIVEYQPFAIWQDMKKKYVTDKEGNLVPIDDSSEFSNLVILSGDAANKHVRSLFNIFAVDPQFSVHIYSATWIGGRRWDIRLENGLLIKLPESNISEAWQSLIKIYNMPGSTVGLKTIDLRIKDKVYLEYEDSAMQKLKTI